MCWVGLGRIRTRDLTSTPDAPLAALQPSPFRELLFLNLLPYFSGVTTDIQVARAEILETLAAYGARTRSELITAARILGFSLSSLRVLSEANNPEMAREMQLRHRNCANALDRPCREVEKTLSRTLACDVPGQTDPAEEPIDDLAEAAVQARLEETRARTPATLPPCKAAV